MTEYLEKPIPSSPDTERVVLGAVMVNNNLAAEAVETLNENDFFRPSHRIIFQNIKTLFAKSSDIDPFTLRELLNGQLETVGGMSGLTNMMQGIPYMETLGKFRAILKEKTLLRDIVKAGNRMIAEAVDAEEDADGVRDRAEQSLFEIGHKQTQTQLEHASIGADEAIAVAEAMSGNDFSGIPSGLVDLDRKTHGWQPGTLTLIGARPSMGKSALAVGIALHAAASVPVAFFSLEMTHKDVSKRILGKLAKVNIHKLTSGKLSKDEWSRVIQARYDLDQRQLFIDDSTRQSAASLRAKLRRLASRESGVGLVVIDYIGFMKATGDYRGNRNHELGEISRDLKEIAKDMAVPVICLCQLNRVSEGKGRPMLSELRDSGELEQNADLVILVYREDYYKEKTTDTNRQEPQETQGLAELIIAKHRNGPTGKVETAFVYEYASFESLEGESYGKN